MASHYRQLLQALLPRGMAWSRAPGAAMTMLLEGKAEELARIDSRAQILIDEADPRTTNEMLTDWERVAGLPDNCFGTLQETAQGRRQSLHSKLVSSGGQSPGYYVGVAADLGYEIEVSEYRPFRVGRSRVGESLTNEDWRFAWSVRAAETTVTAFAVGRSRAGERLATWGNSDLECRIGQLAPAHTKVVFAYGPLGLAALMLQEGGAVLGQSGGAILLENP